MAHPVKRGIVEREGVEYAYIYHWGGKVVLSQPTNKHWSTTAGNFEECPAFIRQAIKTDIMAKEVERCIQGA